MIKFYRDSFVFFSSIIIILILVIPFIIISIFIILESKGPIFHYSDRIGQNSSIFKLIKFRTMKVGAPQISTELMAQYGNKYITKTGVFLRKYSLDELPQIFNILKRDMNFIGPRPALYNQYDLINLRKKLGIDLIKPGITGLAQINGRDSLNINQKVKFDLKYLKEKNLFLDLKILFFTFFKVIRASNVQH